MSTTTTPHKKIANHEKVMPWQAGYGYTQALQVKDTVYLAGQLSHDMQGNLVAPAPLDAQGRPTDFSSMEAQMRQSYRNAAALLAGFGATFDDVVEENLFVLDIGASYAVAQKVRAEFYGNDQPACASNLIGVSQLALPGQLIEVTFRAVLKDA
ncbi:Rid family hydrolase [Pseudoxanthomonas sp. PXM02]|uniref:RidA family protein n=1 Tax=Pseudoxanthomonas sp. PXM02 TaxID=2769294 RepID=UPI001CE04682|nr:Rid family hydrolase [Pseudoxanthomonas sp. PXM02]